MVEAWEAEIAKLEVRYNRPNFLSDYIRTAIFLGMLLKEYKEKVYDRMAAVHVDRKGIYLRVPQGERC